MSLLFGWSSFAKCICFHFATTQVWLPISKAQNSVGDCLTASTPYIANPQSTGSGDTENVYFSQPKRINFRQGYLSAKNIFSLSTFTEVVISCFLTEEELRFSSMTFPDDVLTQAIKTCSHSVPKTWQNTDNFSHTTASWKRISL